MAQLVDRELSADGVNADGYAMLSLIGVRAPVRLTEVAEALGMPLTTASDIVRRLEARKHVKRRPNPEDGRSWLFELTPAGNREWHLGWGALQRIDATLKRLLRSFEQMDAALQELDAAFEAALTDD